MEILTKSILGFERDKKLYHAQEIFKTLSFHFFLNTNCKIYIYIIKIKTNPTLEFAQVEKS